MVNLSDISTRVAEPFPLISNDAICVFVEDEKKQNESKLEKMIPDAVVKLRLPIEEEQEICPAMDTNTRHFGEWFVVEWSADIVKKH